jgi:hypothetical protein
MRAIVMKVSNPTMAAKFAELKNAGPSADE